MKPILEVSLLSSGLLDSSILELEEILTKTTSWKKPVAFAAFRKAKKEEREVKQTKEAKTPIK